METFFGFDEESVDSETLSETSYNTDRTDRTPATPEEDLDEVSKLPYAREFTPLCWPGLLPLWWSILPWLRASEQGKLVLAA